MSKKKNKKGKEPVLMLIDNTKKPSAMERLSKILFLDCLKNGKQVSGCFENDKINIVAYTDKQDISNISIDDISCYIITPKSNSDVSVYIDSETIDVSLGKTASVSFTDAQLECFVANMISYINDFVA